METKNSFISSASVKVQGRTAYYKMLEAVRQGELIQVCRGVYANIDQLSACMVDIESIVPNGILCLWSAWNIHQLTTSMPQAYHVAIKRDRKVKVLSFPKIELHHYTSNILEIGVMEKVIDGFKVKVYDVERCVCDAVKFRNKVGIDVCSEIIDNYLSRPERNISKLMDYARQLLDSGSYNVNEVGLKIGYSTGSHFIAAFKKKFGTTPKKYLMAINTTMS